MIGSACWVEVAGERARGVIVGEDRAVWLVKLDAPVFIPGVPVVDLVLEHRQAVILES